MLQIRLGEEKTLKLREVQVRALLRTSTNGIKGIRISPEPPPIQNK